MGERFIYLDQDTVFEGEVSTDQVVLKGSVNGEIHAADQVLLKAGSVVKGEIATRRYLVEEGALHLGKLRMDLAENGLHQNGKQQVNTDAEKEENPESPKNGQRRLSPFQVIYQSPGQGDPKATDREKETASTGEITGDDNSESRLW
ncbi:MAG: polymer-forming cytoskeletal protein [Balneolaceae bacterium]|nr:polymer-forming cytoskeletal protein [Balneolaceae bacterium]